MKDTTSRQTAKAKMKSFCEKYGISYEDGERKPSTGGSAYALGHAFDDLPPVTPKTDGMTNGEVLETLFPDVGTYFSNVIDLRLWWNAPYKAERSGGECTKAQ